MADLAKLQQLIGYQFKDESKLILALTHPSVAHEHLGQTAQNQRLEFLGDSVLQLVLTLELYGRFTGYEEGPLTKARAQMVNGRSLAGHARRIQLGDFLILSRGEEMSGGRQRESSLADAFEALLGAIFLDSDFNTAQTFILRLFEPVFGGLKALPSLDNPKGELQELLQASSSGAPSYRLDAISGPDHDREFTATVLHQGRELGTGVGKSKKDAESKAAEMALLKLREDSPEEADPTVG